MKIYSNRNPTMKVYHTEPNYRNLSRFLPQHPCRVQASGPSGSGKTNFLLGCLLDPKQPWGECIVFYTLSQPKYKILAKEFKGKRGVTFHEGIPDGDAGASIMTHLESNNKTGLQTCLAFDGLQADLERSKWASALATGGVHHLNLSVFTLLQQVFVSRTQRLQTDWLVLFDFPADKSAVQTLARQMNPGNPGMVMEMYRQAVESRPHGWLGIDLKAAQRGDPLLKYRDSSFTRAFDPSLKKLSPV